MINNSVQLEQAFQEILLTDPIVRAARSQRCHDEVLVLRWVVVELSRAKTAIEDAFVRLVACELAGILAAREFVLAAL